MDEKTVYDVTKLCADLCSEYMKNTNHVCEERLKKSNSINKNLIIILAIVVIIGVIGWTIKDVYFYSKVYGYEQMTQSVEQEDQTIKQSIGGDE